MKRLIKKSDVKTRKDHKFNFEQAIIDFQKEYKLTKEDLKDKSKKNPVYQLWNDYMFENYPIWSMSSVSYILRGWSYLVGGGFPYYYTGYTENSPSTSSDNISDSYVGDIGGIE